MDCKRHTFSDVSYPRFNRSLTCDLRGLLLQDACRVGVFGGRSGDHALQRFGAAYCLLPHQLLPRQPRRPRGREDSGSVLQDRVGRCRRSTVRLRGDGSGERGGAACVVCNPANYIVATESSASAYALTEERRARELADRAMQLCIQGTASLSTPTARIGTPTALNRYEYNQNIESAFNTSYNIARTL